MSIAIRKDQIFVDELIRENARLTIQHEADQQVIKMLRDTAARAKTLEKEVESLRKALDDARSRNYMLDMTEGKARHDILFVMGGGSPCEVCSKKCPMGTTDCKPVWRGERE